ncbi:MAG: HD domain-containing protein [Candidatus Zophobacter franzmannii]|nr:HD domain-containing protein [Candidatus Zophobacter franzmannii]
MEKLFVEELKYHESEEIISYYLCTEKELRDGQANQFLRVSLADRTGKIVAFVWANAHAVSQEFAEGDIVKVQGKVHRYKNQLQIKVDKIRKAEETEVNLADMLPTTTKDMRFLAEQFFQFVDSVKDEHLAKLLRILYDDKEIFSLFSRCRAAKTWHHNYIGGLLEHTVSVASLCSFAATMYPVDRDLVVTGALLHDLGKIYEYEQLPKVDFTAMGRLIGHLALSDEMVVKTAAKINDFPENLLMKLRHLILSHHGPYENASVRLPQTLEAVVLHMCDNLDAQTIGVKQTVEASADDALWSEFDRLNQRYYYKG